MSQYIEFSNSPTGGSRNKEVSVWSKDGQDIQLELGFYYKIIPEKLLDIYDQHGVRKRNKRAPYIHYIEDLTNEAVKNAAVNFVTTEFFTNRLQIDKTLADAVKVALSPVGVNVTAFNLLSVTVPTNFENAVVEKVVRGQEKSILEFVQLSQVKRAEINVIKGRANYNITLLLAEARANATKLLASATAQVDKLLLDTKATVYKELALSLGLHNSTFVDNAALLNYLWSDLVRNAGSNSRLVAGFSNPFIQAKN
jgi:regulator of protease activity HflC (stomatin/prohibitin superfamily)